MAGGQLDWGWQLPLVYAPQRIRVEYLTFIGSLQGTSQWIATRMLHPPLNLLTPLVAELYIHRDRFTLPRFWGALSQPLGSFTGTS